MQTIFTVELLRKQNFGLFIINTKVDKITLENVVYAATVAWKLVWQVRNDIGNVYGMCNFLTDGWCHYEAATAEELCSYLNSHPHGESYRPMTKEEVLFIINNRQQGFL